MLRVTEEEGPARTIITVEGQLSSEYVALIESSCDKAQSKGKRVELFLRDVATIDAAGRTLLRRLGTKGVRLLGKGIYTSYVLQALCPVATEVPDSAVTD